MSSILRPGNGLLEWCGMCLFHGDPDKISTYKLGHYIDLDVVADAVLMQDVWLLESI